MTLKRAIQLFPRPWINGNVTFEEWIKACDVIEEAIKKDKNDKLSCKGES
jgi:hypothetical protein